MEFQDPYRTPRESVKADNFMAATGTPWATKAALDILDKGGNAFDAGMAALLALNVTYPEAAGFPSVAPTLIYDAEKNEIESYCGVGTAPKKATIEYFTSKGYKNVPEMGILTQLVPSSPDALIAILDKRGTMSFNDISKEAIRLASDGFPVHSMMLNHLDLSLIERLGFNVLMPYNAKVYFGGQWWRPLHHKDRFRQPDLARTLTAMADAEKKAIGAGGGRSQGLTAIRDYFYKGPVADAIVKMHEEEDGLFSRSDLENYTGYWEQPLAGDFGEYAIYANQTWNQGAVIPMILQILEGVDLKSMKPDSPEYIHTVIQAVELGIADRDRYFGDPEFVNVPTKGLLSKDYAATRRQLLTPGKAFGQTPPFGDPAKFQTASAYVNANLFAHASSRKASTHDAPKVKTGKIGDTMSHRVPDFLHPNSSESIREKSETLLYAPAAHGPFAKTIDTSYLAVTDKQGNSISLTPSDFPQSPMVPGTGLCLGIRMTQFRLDPAHPSSLAPGKRPRITPNASMVTKNGKLFMTFGTPEGDQQPQALVQVFLNLIVFGMDVQDAIDAPRFRSKNFPDSFSPHEYKPGVVALEKSLYEKVGKGLEAMGYKIEVVRDWHYEMGAVCAIIRDPDTGKLVGGADPRQENWADGR
ncbi:gamma-glutamyltransferase family protein [Candidatus Poribacteria bacterium]|nr:gamma-glutamyltransferase family protein [Candidatus Poribacteria bacterium]